MSGPSMMSRIGEAQILTLKLALDLLFFATHVRLTFLHFLLIQKILFTHLSTIAGSLEAAYSLNWGAREIWGKGGGETLALL